MYQIVLACKGVPTHAGVAGARDISKEFAHRPWHTNVTCVWMAPNSFCKRNFTGGRTMTNSPAKTMALALTFFIAIVIGLAATYPSDSDPKNIKYVLWKNGLYGMNLDTATSTMIGDGSREKLVIGKTKVQLREKFGYLSTPSDVSQYLRGCYQTSAW